MEYFCILHVIFLLHTNTLPLCKVMTNIISNINTWTCMYQAKYLYFSNYAVDLNFINDFVLTFFNTYKLVNFNTLKKCTSVFPIVSPGSAYSLVWLFRFEIIMMLNKVLYHASFMLLYILRKLTSA